jgi:capsular polysaccharide transport system permease protein
MNDPKLNYVGPLPDLLAGPAVPKPWWRAVPLALILVVVAPTVVAAVYFLLIASPRYVSEARFIVRAANQPQPSSLGVALQGVGLSTTSTDAFAVHEYALSQDGIQDLKKQFDLDAMLKPRGADVFSGWPRLGEDRSDRSLEAALERFVTIGYDSATGISTLRVQGFAARDSHALAEAMLRGGERLVNRLNDRASADAVRDARAARDEARLRLADAQAQLTAFRNQEQFIDPARTATEGGQLIGNLLATVAALRAERAQVAAGAPDSPQIPALDNRIAAYERQIEMERAKIAGSSNSLAGKLGAYEDLMLQRELADRELTQSTTALVAAEQEARRQKLYLERIVNPNLPDRPSQPRRLISILIVFATSLLIYGVGWLVWAGVREHRQD